MYIQEIAFSHKDYQEISTKSPYIFSSPHWLSIYESTKLRCYAIYNKDNSPIGCFQLFFDKKTRINHIKNPPFTPHIGLFYVNPAKNVAKRYSFDKSVYKILSAFLTKLKGILTIALPPVHTDMQPFIWTNFKTIPNYTYISPLSNETEESIKKRYTPERRNDIKKALKDEIVIKKSNDYSIIEKMVEYTYSRKNKKVQTNYLKNILYKYATPENSYCFVAYKDEEPIAASFIVHNSSHAIYLLGGYHPQKKHPGAGALVIHNAIVHAQSKKLTHFDFEGSMLPEVERFFRGFGGTLTSFYTINKSNTAIEMGLKLIDKSRF